MNLHIPISCILHTETYYAGGLYVLWISLGIRPMLRRLVLNLNESKLYVVNCTIGQRISRLPELRDVVLVLR